MLSCSRSAMGRTDEWSLETTRWPPVECIQAGSVLGMAHLCGRGRSLQFHERSARSEFCYSVWSDDAGSEGFLRPSVRVL